MRPAARSLERGPLGVGQAQRGAVVDRRSAERLLALAPPVELLRRLVGGIEAALRLERFGGGVIGRHPLRLAAHQVGLDAEPGEILLDRLGVFGLRALEVGVVEAEDERPAMPAGVEPVEQRGAGVADMNAPGRRGRETDDRGRKS